MQSIHKHIKTQVQLLLAFLMTTLCCSAWADEGYFSSLHLGDFPYSTDVARADFNGDSYDDFVMIFGYSEQNITGISPEFHLQNDLGEFNVVRKENPLIGSRVAAADFNNDMEVDLVITGGGTSGSLVFPKKTAVYFNSGDWSVNTGFDFDAPLVLGQLQHAPELAVGDYDDDGDVDIIIGVLEPTGSGTVMIWVNQGGAQGGTVGTFQSITYFEDRGPYNEITALSLGQVSVADNTQDLMFARRNSNKVKVALNDGLSGFSTSTTDITINGTAVNDIQMVADDYMAVASSGSPSVVYHVLRDANDVPTSFNNFREIGTVLQESEKIIPMTLGNQPGFLLSSDFDGNSNSNISSLAFYGFVVFGPNTQLGLVPQCLLPGVTPALATVSLKGNGSSDKDLIMLTKEGSLYQLFNDVSPGLQQCCMTESYFLGVSDPVLPASVIQDEMNQNMTRLDQSPAGLIQAEIWLDSFIKLRDIRNILMPLSLDAQRYVNHYEQHETQLLQLVASDTQIANAWGQVITSWNEPITALLTGSDDQYILTGLQMNELSNFLTLLQNEPGVGATVTSELTLVQPLMNYVGGTMQDFTADTIAVSSPIIFLNGFE